jgi:hypothetical protein
MIAGVTPAPFRHLGTHPNAKHPLTAVDGGYEDDQVNAGEELD